MIGEIRYNLERVNINANDINPVIFSMANSAVKNGETKNSILEISKLAEKESKRGLVIFIYDFGTSNEQPIFLKIADGLFNTFIAPMDFLRGLRNGPWLPFSSYTRESFSFTNRFEVFIFKNGAEISHHKSQLNKWAYPKNMPKFGEGEITHVHLKKYFDKYLL